MNAGIFDIYVDKNSDFYVEFEYVDSNDNAINLNYNVKFQARKSSINTQNMFSIYSNGFFDENDEFYGGTDYFPGILTVQNNLIILQIESETMKKLYPGQYFYYIILYNENEEKTFLKGRFSTETP